MGAAAAAIAMRSTFGEPGLFYGILSFLDDSSQLTVCGAGATDIANIAELDDFPVDPMTPVINRIQQLAMYQESWYHETEVIGRIFVRN